MFVITGGGSGIGRSLALSLAARGESVLIIGRREALLKDVAANSPLIDYFCADVSSTQGIESIKNHLAGTRRIDGLVNNAGILDPICELTQIKPEDWQHILNTNLNASLFLPQAMLDKLKQGRVLNIGSGAAYFPIKGWAAYCVSKAALSMLTRCWQHESQDLYFGSVMPGIIDTDMQVLARSSSSLDPEQVTFYRRLKDTGRLISTETVAQFLTWLLLDVDSQTFAAQEWDIYTTSHHMFWLKPPNQVLHWDF